ncbi:MAG: (2Fe-2S) ferredoxin domain-containing protein, partial [Burkholderiales bacterium]|nr:(2Fe-2S) ferredoxin domain-containing protein [Burkholderiales bacterium]
MTRVKPAFDAAVKTAKSEWDRLRSGKRPIIHIGSATCGLAAGAGALTEEIRRELRRLKVDAEVVPVGCIGMCFAEPLIDIEVPGSPRVCYAGVTT